MPEAPNLLSPLHLLQAKGLRVTLGGTEVLSGVDFAIHAGEIMTVLGPNGSGKGTRMRALLGMIPVQVR